MWEYREIEARLGVNDAGSPAWQFFNAESGRWDPLISDETAFMTGQRTLLNELGAVGWELVNASEQVILLDDTRHHFSRRYYLKRPA